MRDPIGILKNPFKTQTILSGSNSDPDEPNPDEQKKPTKTGSIQGSFGDPDGIFEDPTTDEASPHHRHFGLQKRQQIPQRPLNIKNIFHSPKSPTANKSEEAVTADTLTLTLTLTHTHTNTN